MEKFLSDIADVIIITGWGIVIFGGLGLIVSVARYGYLKINGNKYVIKIATAVKVMIKFVFWVVFAFAELIEYNTDDYKMIITLFMSAGMASVFVPVMIFFARFEYFQTVAAICFGFYVLSGILFCLFVKSQAGYNFLTDRMKRRNYEG